MPLEITLTIPEIELINPLRALAPEELTTQEASKGVRVVDLHDIALTEDVYGNAYSTKSEVAAFLGSYAQENILQLEDLVTPTESGRIHPDFLGVWRLDFLRYLKATARDNRVDISLHYLHERGDYPYETASWLFNFADPVNSRELLEVTDHDGGQWTATAWRGPDGKITTW